jgi:hypothetical protein
MISPNKFQNLRKLDRYLQWACYAALSLSMLFLFLCVFESFSHDTFSKTPKDLIAAIQLAERKIEEGHPISLKSKSFDELARQSLMPLSAEPYQIGVWCPPLWEYRLRSSPQLYPVQSLLASSGYGAFSTNTGTSESRPQYPNRNISPVQSRNTQGYRWVIVTGIIENRKEIDAFNMTFKGTQYRNAGLDYPDYQYFQVERAEVSNNSGDGQLQWEQRPVRSMYDLKNRWSGTSDDLVDAKYFPPPRNGISFAFPLGPLVNESWDDKVSHPQIALYEAELRDRTVIQPVSAIVEEEDPFGNATNMTPSPLQRNRNLASGQYGGGILASSEKPDILFMRYIDYDVQPEKKYCYRVKLILQNPNWKVPKKYLETTNLGESQYLKTAWSQPTPIVSVPRATKIELVAADTRRGYALVKLVHFDLQTGGNLTNEFKVNRGEIMNYYNQEYYSPINSASRQENDLPSLIPSLRKPTESRQVDYVTNQILVDFQAGNRLPGRHRQTGPSSILLMDGDGNLSVLEEDEHPVSTPPARPSGQIAAAPRISPRD